MSAVAGTVGVRFELTKSEHRALKMRAAEVGKTLRALLTEMVQREVGTDRTERPRGKAKG